MPPARKLRTANNARPVFGRSLKEFRGGPPQLFRDLLNELKRFLSIESLFTAPDSPEKLNLMRKAWDMGKDPLTIMRSSPHALASALKLWLSCLPEPLLPTHLCLVLLQATSYLQADERLRVLQQIFNQVDRQSLQVLFPLLELLHHHRLNVRHADSLPSVFAPLLLPPPAQLHGHPMTAAGMAACEAFIDIMIVNYRTIFAGAVPLSMLPMVPPQPDSTSFKPQQGVFGGHDAVRAMFGWGSDASDDESDCHAWSADEEDTALSGHPCSMAVDDANSCDAAVPRGPCSGSGILDSDVQSVPEVQNAVECLVMDSLDAMLFCEDDAVFTQCCERTFSMPLSNMNAMSERSSSLGSCRSMDDDDGAAGGGHVSINRAELHRSCGAKSAVAEQLSPTSHLPERPFTSALFQHLQQNAHSSFSYLHAEMWAAMHLHGAPTSGKEQPSNPKAAAASAAASSLMRPPSGADGCQGQHAMHRSGPMDLNTWQGHTMCQ